MVCCCLVALDLALFGPPIAFRPAPYAYAAGGVAAGLVYYAFERARLGLAHRDALRVSRRSAWTVNAVSQAREAWAGGLVLALAGAVEECLFRWYVLVIPLEYGMFGVPLCVAVSAIGYAVLHHDIGLGAMVSRGLFGLVAALAVLESGQLLVAVLAHITYNIAVHLRPVQYLRLKEGMQS
jgi:membrane protease YdiL (CAAX protease family)